MKTFVGVCLFFAAIPLLILLNGWYIATLWAWLVVPAFGLPAIGVPVAIGVAMVAEAIHPTPIAQNRDKDKRSPVLFIEALITPLFRVGFGLLMASIVRGYI